MSRLRIGIDCTCWRNWRGYGRFTRSLVTALLDLDGASDYVLFFDPGSHAGDDLPARGKHVVARTERPQAEAASADGRRSLADLARMTAIVAREPLDVFLCPSVYSYFPLVGRFAKVVVLHDAIAERHPELVFPSGRGRLFWRAKVWLALRQADRLATVSEFARRDLAASFGLLPERLAVIPEAPAAAFRPPATRGAAAAEVAERFGVREPYLLYVGGFGPHKNLAALVDTFAALSRDERFARHVLLLVGERRADVFHSTVGDLERRIADLGLGSRVRFLDFVPDPTLAALYQAAEVLVLPSLREGYGLPGVEAMACGTPVVATRSSALPEIVGEAGRWIDPERPEELGAALASVLGDPSLRSRMRLAALGRAGLLTWRRSAEAALALLREAAGHRVE